jgi:photosystem II stability/assembly factor-like uncharacterized protein
MLCAGILVSIRSFVSPETGQAAPKAPNPWFHAERAFPLGHIPLDRWRAAKEQARLLKAQVPARGGNWIPRGPTNVGGRITDVAVDALDADIVYAGAAEGGVLRSTDGGQHWTPLFDQQPSLAIGALAIDPANRETIYAGTGEVNPGGGSAAYGGAGLFRSTDMGGSWAGLGLENSGSIGRIRIDPTDSQRIFVAVMGHLWEASAERGVYRSTDGGANWENVLYIGTETGCVDLVLRPDNPDVLFAAMWERIRQPEYYRYGGATCGVYRTTDGGDSWSVVGGGLPGASADGGRIGLSLCHDQPDVMHAVYADKTGYFDGLYASSNGGTTWARTNDGSLSGVFSSYGWWFGNVRTHPRDPNTIFVLGLDFYRSTNGGSSWAWAGGSMHVDHHALDFGSGTSPVLYEGNDGGVYRSTNGGTAWTMLPDQPITQVYRAALDAGNPDALYLGAQDNGTWRTLSGASDNWQFIYGGDGFQPLVHPFDSTRIWAQYQYGELGYSENNGASFAGATNGIGGGDRRNWNSPLAQDPTDPNRRYFGTNRVYRSSSSTSWTAVSPDLTGGPHSGNPGQVCGTLTTLAVSPLDGQVIWAGSDDGHVSVTTNGGGDWTAVSAGLPVRWITAVRPSPRDRETALVAISGFRWNEPLPHIFRTTDLGQSWSPVAGNLPEAPVNDLVIDPLVPDRWFTATDVGVYETVDGGVGWHALGAGLPDVVVHALVLQAETRTLVAGTFGRSVFSIVIGDGTGRPRIVAGPGPGSANPPLVRTFDSQDTGTAQSQWTAYSVDAFGVNTACGDLNGDGLDDVVTGPGPGAIFGPHIRAFDGWGSPLPEVNFQAYGTLKYGVNVACGDIDADGFDEIVSGAGPGAVFGPHVRGWDVDGATAAAIPGVSFLAYGTNKYGVNVACGDLDGDGFDEIVSGAGPGAVFGPHVRGWDVDGATAAAMTGVSFLAYGTNKFGVHVACGDIDGDGFDEIVTGAGPGAVFAAHLRAWNYDGAELTPVSAVNLFAYPADDYRFGVRVSTLDLDGDGRDEILTVPGPDPARPAMVRAWKVGSGSATLVETVDFDAYSDLQLTSGGTISGGRF